MPGLQVLKSIFKADVSRAGPARSTLDQIEPPVTRDTGPELVTSPQTPSQPPPDPTDVPIPDTAVQDAESAAGRLSQATMHGVDENDPWQFNYGTFGSPDEVKSTIANIADDQQDAIQAQRGGKRTDEELYKLAADLGTSQDVVRTVLGREFGETFNDKTILRARKFLGDSATSLRVKSQIIAGGNATDNQKIEFYRHLKMHEAFQAQLMGARAEAGRLLRAFGTPMGGNSVADMKIAELMTTDVGGDINDMARRLSNIDSGTGVNKFVREYTQSKTANALHELYITSLLSSPMTHAFNAVGNIFFQGMNLVEAQVAEQIGRFTKTTAELSQKHSLDLADDAFAPGEATAMLYGTLSAWKDAFKLAGKAFWKGESQHQVGKVEYHEPAIDAGLWGTKRWSEASAEGGAKAKAQGVAGEFLHYFGEANRFWLNRVMLPIDEFAQAMAWRSKMAGQAYNRASGELKSGLISEADFAARVQNYMESKPAGMADTADQYALEMTFQEEMGRTGKLIQRGMNAVPFGWVAQPFIRTPGNIFREGLVERSPLGIVSQDFRDKLAGKYGKRERDLAITRLSIGSMTTATAAMFTASGSLTGAGPSDPAAQKFLRDMYGWQPFSYVTTDENGNKKYTSYLRYDPVSAVLAATSTMVEMRQYKYGENPLLGMSGEDETEYLDAAAMLVGGLSEGILGQSFMTGISQTFSALDEPDRYMNSLLMNIGSSAVPWSSFRRWLSYEADPVIRNTHTMIEKMRATSGIPGYSEGVMPNLDAFGRPIYRPMPESGVYLGIFPAYRVSEGKMGEIEAHMKQVYDNLRKVPIRPLKGTIDGYKLSAQNETILAHIARNEPIIRNKTFEESLKETVRSKSYRDEGWEGKLKMIRDVQEDYDSTARDIFKQRYPEVAEKIELIKKARNRWGQQ